MIRYDAVDLRLLKSWRLVDRGVGDWGRYPGHQVRAGESKVKWKLSSDGPLLKRRSLEILPRAPESRSATADEVVSFSLT